jgi:Ran GTPase-activating protein (RanGAP) involved in mRNA processing and transport
MNSVSSIFRSSDSSRQTAELSEQFDKRTRLATMDMSGNYISDSSIQRLCRSIKSRTFETRIRSLKLRFLGDLGKKLRSVETVEDMAEALQRIRDGLKLFS